MTEISPVWKKDRYLFLCLAGIRSPSNERAIAVHKGGKKGRGKKEKKKDETEKVAEAGSINSFRDALWDTRRGLSGGNDRLSYRSGTVNSKSFVGKDLLRIKWKFELN